MIAITIGFRSSKKGEPVNLYTGSNADEARALLENPPRGIIRTELFQNAQYVKRRVHDPERAGAVEASADTKLELEVKVLDLPAVRAIIDLAAEKLAEANAKLVEAGMDPVEILFTEDLEEADEEDLKQLDALKALETMARKLQKQSEDLDVLREEMAAANGELIARQEELAKLREELEEARKAGPPAAGDSDGGTPPLQLEGSAPNAESKPPKPPKK